MHSIKWIQQFSGAALLMLISLSACQQKIAPTTSTPTQLAVPSATPATTTSAEYSEIPIVFGGKAVAAEISPPSDQLVLLSETGLYLYSLADQRFLYMSEVATANTLAWSSDSRQIVVGLHDGSILFIDPESGQVTDTLDLNTDIVRTLIYSPDGTKLAATFGQGKAGSHTLVILDTTTLETLASFDEASFGAVEWLSDSSALTLHRSYYLSIWDDSTGELKDFEGQSQVNSSVWLDDSALLIVWDGEIGVWDMETDQQTASYPDPQIIADVQPLDEQRVLIAHGGDTPILLWDYAQDITSTPFGDQRGSEIALNDSAHLIAVANSLTKNVFVFESATFAKTASLSANVEHILDLVWSSDGRWLMVHGTNGVVLFDASQNWAAIDLVP